MRCLRSTRERIELRGILARLALSQQPDGIVDRLAAGEHPLSVLTSAAEAGTTAALPPGKDVTPSPKDDA